MGVILCYEYLYIDGGLMSQYKRKSPNQSGLCLRCARVRPENESLCGSWRRLCGFVGPGVCCGLLSHRGDWRCHGRRLGWFGDAAQCADANDQRNHQCDQTKYQAQYQAVVVVLRSHCIRPSKKMPRIVKARYPGIDAQGRLTGGVNRRL